MRVEKSFKVRPLEERGIFTGYLANYEGLIAALSYALSSTSIIIFNKTIFSTYGFQSPVFVCLVHMAISFTLVVMLKLVGAIDYKDFELRLLWKMVPLSICFVGNILLGLLGTKLLSIPMFTTLRRLTALFIITATYFRTGSFPSAGIAIAVSLLIFGAVVAGYNDLYFDPVAYSIVLLNNVATAGYLQITKDVKEDVSKFGLLFYNSMISMPMLLILALVFDEYTYVSQFEQLNSLYFQICFVLGGAMAFTVNVTTAWCTQTNSPLTTCITGQTKNILTTLLGAILFTDFGYNHLIALGIGISICGSIVYAYNKYRENFKL
jgi:hypothetical protein